jgi:malonate decarboxylase epsilon subunit
LSQEISSIVEGVATDSQPAFVSNLNVPRQIVVAGFVRAIEEVLARARALGARKTELLRVSVPAHCPLMVSVAHSLDQLLQDMEVRDPKRIYISNIQARAQFERLRSAGKFGKQHRAHCALA